MKLPFDIPVYGDVTYRGDCPAEGMEQVTFVNRVRREHSKTWGKIIFHPRNEGRRTHYQVLHEKAAGMTTGASDIIIPGGPTFVCEIKRRNHMKSKLSEEQEVYLNAAKEAGAFVCIALGADAAWQAFEDYVAEREAQRQGGGCSEGRGRKGSGDPVGGSPADLPDRVLDPRPAARAKARGRRGISRPRKDDDHG